MVRTSEKLKALFRYRRNIWNMAVACLNAKYSNSFLGIASFIVNPLLIVMVITFVFNYIIKVRIQNYPLFILAGIFPWLFFSNSLFSAAFSVINHQGILKQFVIPREVLPISCVLSDFLNFLVGWCVLLPFFVVFNVNAPLVLLVSPSLLIAILFAFVFACGAGLIVSVVNVFFRDFGSMLNSLLMFIFWATPVFYPVEMVPEGLRWIIYLNPASSYILFFQSVLLDASVPSAPVIMAVAGWGAASLITGLLVFWSCEVDMLKRL